MWPRQTAQRAAVLVDEDAGDAAGIHRHGEMFDVFLGQEFWGEFRLRWSEVGPSSGMSDSSSSVDRAVVVLYKDEDVRDRTMKPDSTRLTS